jgi:probable phosphoglycerate mutase
MPAPTIYYMRHGETDWNVEGRLQGGIDTPLNALGRTQAAHAGRILANLFVRHGRAASSLAYVASPLQRARVTMDTVRAELKLPPGGYALDDRLREIGYGHWEGSTLAQARVSHPELYASRELDKWGALPPGGESYALVQVRMRDWVRLVESGHRRGGPWRHRAGADGGAGHRNTRRRVRFVYRAGRCLSVQQWRRDEV